MLNGDERGILLLKELPLAMGPVKALDHHRRLLLPVLVVAEGPLDLEGLPVYLLCCLQPL